MTSKEAYEKINHTLCLNSMNLNFSIDDVEHLDCVNPEEMIECLEIIEKDVEILDLIKKHKHIFLYAIFINQDNYCGQEIKELEKRDKFKEEINKIKEYLGNGE